jgi:hypothetical protein
MAIKAGQKCNKTKDPFQQNPSHINLERRGRGAPLHTTVKLASAMFLACSYSRHDVQTILYTPEGADVSVSSGKKKRKEKKKSTKKPFTNWLGGREKDLVLAVAVMC